MHKQLTLAEIAAYTGREIGRSQWLRIDQKRVDAFADCTDDPQWIHVDPERAARGPYGRTVVHGFLLMSLIPYLSRNISLIPQGAVMAVNYGINRARFIRPVPVGSEIRDSIVQRSVTDRGEGKILLANRHTIHIRGEAEPACVVEMLRLWVTAV